MLLNDIKQVEWFIITKQGCGYCAKAIELLIKEGYYDYLTYNAEKDFFETIYPIIEKYIGINYPGGYKSFPIIFNNGKFFGGYAELEDYFAFTSPITSNIHMMEPIHMSQIKYVGTPWNALIVMLYLTWRYPNDCVVIPKNNTLTDSGKVTSWVKTGLREFQSIMLVWNHPMKEIQVPYQFWTSFQECLNKKVRFIVMPFGFECGGNIGHANYLVYDTKNREMERFEPNTYVHGICYNPPNLDIKIKNLFNQFMSREIVKKIYSPLEYCPRDGFQVIQHGEKQKKSGDPGGFCAAWVAWYADLRLANPNKSREQVVNMAMEYLRKQPQSFTQFIRSYAGFIDDVGEKIRFDNNNPVQVFTELKQKYT